MNMKLIKKFCKSKMSLDRLNSVHGECHWERVAMFGQRLCSQDPRINARVVELFAYFHDCQRKDDGYDEEHGLRAALLLDTIREDLLKELSDEEFSQLRTACRFHTIQIESTGDATIDACIDADRLDLGRVGIIPDPDQMLSSNGARMALSMMMEILSEAKRKCTP